MAKEEVGVMVMMRSTMREEYGTEELTGVGKEGDGGTNWDLEITCVTLEIVGVCRWGRWR